MIVSKRLDKSFAKILIIFHSILFIIFITAFYGLLGEKLFFEKNTLFMVFFCSGVLLSGYALRSAFPLTVKIYFAVFLSSIVVFIYSPSTLISWINLQKKATASENEFALGENYFLTRQQSMFNVNPENVSYKLVKRAGRFNKTIQRDIYFGHQADSVKTVSIYNDSLIILQVYLPGRETGMTNSILRELLLKSSDKNVIIQKRK